MARFVTRFALAIIASAVCIAAASQVPAEDSKPVSFALFAPGQSEKTVSALTKLFTHDNKNASVSVVKNLPDAIASKADIVVLALSVKEFNSLGPYDADALKKRKVIGISYGAAKLYGEIGLKISWGACAHGMEPRIKVVDNATIAKAGFDKVFGVYAPNAPQYPASDVEYMPFGIFDGFPAIHKGLEDVDVVARFNGDLGYAPIVRQGNKILIGFNPHAEDWTEQFGDLMRKLAAALNEPLKNPGSQPVATHAPQTLEGDWAVPEAGRVMRLTRTNDGRLGAGEKVEIAQEGTELPEPKRDVPPESKSEPTKSRTIESVVPLRNGKIIFRENFDGITNGNVGTQYQTGLQLTAFADLPGWTKAGPHAVHGVMVAPGNRALQIYDAHGGHSPDNDAVTLNTSFPANASHVTYQVTFDAGPTVWASASPEHATGSTDQLQVQLIDPSNNVVASYMYAPGAWDGSQTLRPAGFVYTGTGTGDLRFVISGNTAPQRFAGAIDNLVVSTVESSTGADGLKGRSHESERSIVVRDREGKEKLRFRLDPRETVEINQESTDSPEPEADGQSEAKSGPIKSQTIEMPLPMRRPSGRFSVFAPFSDKQSIEQLMAPLRMPKEFPVAPSELGHKTGGELKSKPEPFPAVEIVTSLADMKPDDNGVLIVVVSDEGFKKLGKYDPGALKRQRTIGIGLGAAKLFGELGLEINWGNCAEGTIGEPRLTVTENGLIGSAKFPSPIFAFEPPIHDSKDSADAFVFGVFIGPDKQIRRNLMEMIALETTDKEYAAVVRQGRHILVGVDGPVNKWSPNLKRLVTELAVSLDTHSLDNSDGVSGKKDGGLSQP